ncbi:MAG TPA: hypothetical protein PLU43_00400, partial [Lachnospiraceae bacterium]|nr:hypothetical protein [Lachnospiraceae bacterium]
MNVMIVYDSYFGNNEKAARIMSDAITLAHQVKAVHIKEMQKRLPKETDLLVIGTPTRVFRPSGPVIRFIKSLDRDFLKDRMVSVYDTRMDVGKLDVPILKVLHTCRGSAAAYMEKKLLAKKAVIIGEPAGFVVCDSVGPFEEG